MQTGIDVLGHGLPELPAELSYLMTIPVAYWTAQQCAALVFLQFRRHGRQHRPMALQIIYWRGDHSWIPPKGFAGTSFRHDPIANPGDRHDLNGRPMVHGGASEARQETPGRPAVVLMGRAAPAVTHLAVIQDGHVDKRRMDSHFGAWVVCTERLASFEMEGMDKDRHRAGNTALRPDCRITGSHSAAAQLHATRQLSSSANFPTSVQPDCSPLICLWQQGQSVHVIRPDDSEMSPVQGGDFDKLQPLRQRNNRCICGPERKTRVGDDQVSHARIVLGGEIHG
jgi:hypothetical protein